MPNDSQFAEGWSDPESASDSVEETAAKAPDAVVETPAEEVEAPKVKIELDPDFDNEDGDVLVSVPGYEDRTFSAGQAVEVDADEAETFATSAAVRVAE